MKRLLTILIGWLCIFAAHAYQFIFEGEAAGIYPITIEVDRYPHGAIYGRYAYNSTLKSLGRKAASAWLNITPVSNSSSDYTITDSQGNMQERWTGATFWRENGVNYFTVTVTNAKGKTFGITAHSSSKNSSTWTGTYNILSDGYRMSPPPISVFLTLSAKGGGNTFTGTWVMTLCDDGPISQGMMMADIVGTLSNGVMTLKLTNIVCNRGSDGCYFTRQGSTRIHNGTVVAKIKKKGKSYTITPVGDMKKYLTDLGGILSITKTE